MKNIYIITKGMQSVSLAIKANRILYKHKKLNNAIPKDIFIKLNKKYDIKYKIPIANNDIIDTFSDELNYKLFCIINTFEPPLTNCQKNYIYNFVMNVTDNNDFNEEQIEFFHNFLNYYNK